MFRRFDYKHSMLGVYLSNKENRAKIVLILVCAVFLISATLYRDMMSSGQYGFDEEGNLTFVERRTKGAESHTLHMQVRKGKVKEDRDVTLTFSGIKKKKNRDSKRGENSQAAMDREISAALREVEANKDQRIELPVELPDGIVIKWSRSRGSHPGIIVLLAGLLIAMMVISDDRKEKQAHLSMRESVKRSLPVFSDQIMMLMSCGLIFADAFRRVAEGYEKNKESNGFFENMILDCQNQTVKTNMSLLRILKEKATHYRIREFSRIVSYIADNQSLGVDLIGKLEVSGEELWEERKKLAEEKGKMAETRLTMPLAVLLLVLILVTGAPAIIQVKGG